MNRLDPVHLRAVVAVPARDEEAYLPACLAALALQRDLEGRALQRGAFGVVLLLNNCRDKSAEIARAFAPSLRGLLRIVETQLPPRLSHAGGARRLAMDIAAEWLDDEGSDGVILTTDADTAAPPTWVAANLSAIEAGVDAVAGDIVLNAADIEMQTALLRTRGALEATYEARLIEIGALLDPQSHNPWPHHATASGASLALTLSAYRLIGGLPALALGEDKALVAALSAHDARIRFAPDIRVVTSGRFEGRAIGGAADTMRLRSLDPHALCDQSLEPARKAVERARWRRRLRALHADARLTEAELLATPLGLSKARARGAARCARFGAAWRLIEEGSPSLRRRRLTPIQLIPQIRRAEAILATLRGPLEPADEVQAKLVGPLLTDDPREVCDLL